MTPDDLRQLVEPERTSLRARGVTALYVFGSVARGEATPNSDVDVIVEYDPASDFNIIDLSRSAAACRSASEPPSTW